LTSRRDYGTGSVRQRPSGVWQASFALPVGPDGKRRRKSVTGKTRADALRKLEEAKRAAAVERDVPEQEPLACYLESWLEDRHGDLKPSTRQRYRELVRHTATVGNIAVGNLKPTDLRALYRALLRTLSPQTVLHVHRVLHKALQDAMREERIGRNVCDLVRPPSVPDYEPATLDIAQSRRLLAAAREDRFHALWLLMVATGMREGELLGLCWPDLDRTRGVLTIRRNVRRVAGLGWQVGTPKTRASGRKLPLPPFLLAALREHRERQDEERRRTPDWHDMGLIFPSRAGTYMETTNLIRRHWRKVLGRAGLPSMRPHDLRHSAVSLLLAAGVPPHVVQAIVGHADARVTMAVYAHSRQEDEAAALAGLADRLLASEG